ncbi:hypothetical protein BZL43_14635 [Pseudomonas sp. PICF141]|nr:hypothetical protein BZL43_14635 [Pseudomonas sp. PICF141]
MMIVPTLCVGMPQWTLCVRLERDAERPALHSHAERGNDQQMFQFDSTPHRFRALCGPTPLARL